MGLQGRSQRTSVLNRARSSSLYEKEGEEGEEESKWEFSPVYRDFARETREKIVKVVEPPKAKRKGPRGGVQMPFPSRLFDMLEAVHQEGLEHIVSWQPHGRSFIVRKPVLFESEILPRFFSQSKMSSFQRQLNLYGFLRQNTGKDRGSYYHELFLRSRPDLPQIMLRTRVKGIGMGRTNRVEKEPDFYKMTPCLPSDAVSAATFGQHRRRSTMTSPDAISDITTPTVAEDHSQHHHEDDDDEMLLSTPHSSESNLAYFDTSVQQDEQQQQQRHDVYPAMGVRRRVKAASRHPPARVSPSSAALVSPEDNGRPLFTPSCTRAFTEMAPRISAIEPLPSSSPAPCYPAPRPHCASFESRSSADLDYRYYHKQQQPQPQDQEVYYTSVPSSSCPPLTRHHWNVSDGIPMMPLGHPQPHSHAVPPPTTQTLPVIPYLQPRFAASAAAAAAASCGSMEQQQQQQSSYQHYYYDHNLEDTGLFEGLEFQVVDDDSLEQFESDLIVVPEGNISNNNNSSSLLCPRSP